MSYDSQSFELIKLDQACRKLRSYQHDKKKIKMRQLMTIVISLKKQKRRRKCYQVLGEIINEDLEKCWFTESHYKCQRVERQTPWPSDGS